MFEITIISEYIKYFKIELIKKLFRIVSYISDEISFMEKKLRKQITLL